MNLDYIGKKYVNIYVKICKGPSSTHKYETK